MPLPAPLPLILAGPILRRVEPNLVSVWVALSEPRDVEISLWDGLVRDDGAEGGNLFHTSQALLRPTGSQPTPAVRSGDHLFIAVATF